MPLPEDIFNFLKSQKTPICAKFIAQKLQVDKNKVYRTLRSMVNQGILDCNTSIEFDNEFNPIFGNVFCQRKRNYYWIKNFKKKRTLFED